MTVYALINKEVIPYVCKCKKVTNDFIYEKTKLDLKSIEKWLDVSDSSLPTILQAKKIAKCLHIPFAGLYMNTEDINVKSIPSIINNRTFNGSLSIDDSGFNIAVCDVLQERDFLIDENIELEIPIIPFTAPSCKTNDPVDWANAIRSHYAISLKDQFRCKSSRKFYLYIRDRLENKGVFVQCFTDVPIEIVRGFSIYEPTLPIIGINDEDRPPAKSFSLIHELVHLIKRESSACNIMYNAKSTRSEEVFCNAVAGELLVPKNTLSLVLNNESFEHPYSVDNIVTIAERFSVSKEVIIRRLLDCKYIDDIEYAIYSEEFKKILEKEREEQRIARKEGIKVVIPRSISREAIDRTSSSVCRTLYYGYTEEIYSKRDIAHHLRIAQKHVDGFIREVSKWNR